MSPEARQALKTVGLSTLVIAALVALAWWSLLGLVLVTLGVLLGLAVGWNLGARHAAAQAGQTRRARRRTTQPKKTMGEQVTRRPARPTR